MDRLLLYYITDRSQFPGDESARQQALLRKIAEAAACEVDFIQLREKDLLTREFEALAHAAARIIRKQFGPGTEKQAHGTRLLINARLDVAIACGADGVHLRSDDISARDVRTVWVAASENRPPVVTVSCHATTEVARAASSGADFAVFAPVFEKKDLPSVSGAGLAALHKACRQNIPVLALGGVNLENAHPCLEAGAAGIAAIRLFQDQDIARVVRILRG